MLAFGHVGITLGAAALLAKAFSPSRSSEIAGNEVVEPHSPSSQFAAPPGNLPDDKASALVALGNRVDIRLLLVGSLLPDIIDKPIGHLFFRNTISNGRTFCHTLLFLLIITLAGLYLYNRHGKTSLLAISFGTFTHLIFDQMWRTPRTLFWPVYGVTFDREDLSNWIQGMFHGLVTDPQVYIPELVGIAILLWFFLTLVRKQKVFYFLKYGRVQQN